MGPHLVIFVEEESMEAFLNALLPRILPETVTFEIGSFQGKLDLPSRVPDRLRGESSWAPSEYRWIVLVDQDDDNCIELKQRLERAATDARLRLDTSNPNCRRVLNRIVVQELESWYFGDWQAVVAAYPRASPEVASRARFRDPDRIRNAWEAFEAVMQPYGYFRNGLRKIEAARAVGQHILPERSRSQSFHCFINGLFDLARYSGQG